MDLLDLLSHYTLWVGNVASNYSGIKGKKCNIILPFCGFSSTCGTCCVTDVYLQIPVVFVLSGIRTDGSFFSETSCQNCYEEEERKGFAGPHPVAVHLWAPAIFLMYHLLLCRYLLHNCSPLLCILPPQQHRESLLGRGICLRLPDLKTLGGLCGPGSLGFTGPVITTVLFTHLTTRVFHGTRNCYRSCAFILRFRWPFSVLLKETWIFPAEPRHKHLCLDPPVQLTVALLCFSDVARSCSWVLTTRYTIRGVSHDCALGMVRNTSHGKCQPF